MTSAELTVLQPYCENDMRLLKRISKSIFLRLGEPLTEADYDDFYSIANIILTAHTEIYGNHWKVLSEGI